MTSSIRNRPCREAPKFAGHRSEAPRLKSSPRAAQGQSEMGLSATRLRDALKASARGCPLRARLDGAGFSGEEPPWRSTRARKTQETHHRAGEILRRDGLVDHRIGTAPHAFLKEAEGGIFRDDDEQARRQDRISPCQQQQIGAVEPAQFAVRDDEVVPGIRLALAQLEKIARDLDALEADRFENDLQHTT